MGEWCESERDSPLSRCRENSFPPTFHCEPSVAWHISSSCVHWASTLEILADAHNEDNSISRAVYYEKNLLKFGNLRALAQLPHLYYFWMVAREGSVTKASECSASRSRPSAHRFANSNDR